MTWEFYLAIAGLVTGLGGLVLLLAFLAAGKRADERDEALIWRIAHGDWPHVPNEDSRSHGDVS